MQGQHCLISIISWLLVGILKIHFIWSGFFSSVFFFILMILNKNIKGSFSNLNQSVSFTGSLPTCMHNCTYLQTHTYLRLQTTTHPANSEAHITPVPHDLTLHVTWARWPNHGSLKDIWAHFALTLCYLNTSEAVLGLAVLKYGLLFLNITNLHRTIIQI